MGVSSLFDTDDMFDEESDEYNLADEPPEQTAPAVQPIRSAPASHERESSCAQSPRNVRVRPMPRKLAEKHPDVVSIMWTRRDGKQLILVRKAY